MTMTKEQFAKLPKYAQDELKDLNRKVRDIEEELFRTYSVLPKKTYTAGQIDDPRHTTGIIVDPIGDHPLAIAKNHSVRFWLEPDKFYIDVHMKGGTKRPFLELMGFTSLGVLPSCSNVIHVEEGKW